MTTAWDLMEAKFWPLFKAAGMLRKVRVKPTSRPQVDVDVSWREPDNLSFAGSQSKDYEMEYQYADLPTLAEGDVVTLLDLADQPIPKMKFRVRESPTVTSDPTESQTGFFREAILTKL